MNAFNAAGAKVVFPPVSLAGGMDLDATIQDFQSSLRVLTEVDQALKTLEQLVSVRVAEIRRRGANQLLGIEKVRQLGLPVDANKVASAFEAQGAITHKQLKAILGMVRKSDHGRQEENPLSAKVDSHIRSQFARIKVELAEVVRLLREAADKSEADPKGIGARAVMAYAEALEASIEGAEVVGITPLMHHGEFTPVLEVKLSKPMSAHDVAAAEHRAHQIVENVDPALVGVFALEFSKT